MKKWFLIVAIVFFFIVRVDSQSVDVRHFLLCPSVNGISGFAHIPSAYVLHSNTLSLGLHRFEFKANYGLFDMLEAGIYFDFSYSSNLIDILKAGKLNIKFHFLDEEQFFISFATGIKECPLNVFEKIQDKNFDFYFVISKKITDANITLGLEENLTSFNQDIANVGILVAISKVIYDTILLVAEYERGICNVGLKISMNSNITIDVFVKDIGRLSFANSFGDFLQSNFIFGIDYLQ